MRSWMRDNLSMQGYGLTDAERRQLWLGLRFPTALCLAPVLTALLCSALFAVRASTAGLVLGGVLVAVCGLLSATNLCIPSLMLGWWDSRRRQEVLA